MQLLQQGDEVDERAAEAVHAPGRHHVELLARDAPQEGVELRPVLAPLRAADAPVDELGRDVPAQTLRRFAQHLAPGILNFSPVRADLEAPETAIDNQRKQAP
jgi:hypothetical protein